MSQLKVFEFAKQVGLETLVLMDKIKEWKLPIKSHMATLDEEMIQTIQKRLSEESAASQAAAKSKTKGTTRKAGTTKASTKTKAASPVKTVKKAAATAGAEAEGAPKKVVVKTKKAAGPGVLIRRKADIAAKEEAAAQAAAEQAAREAEAQQAASEAASSAPQTEAQSSAAAAATEAQGQTQQQAAPQQPTGPQPLSGPAAAGATTPPRRTNIVGRMDLSKARPPVGAIGGPRPGGQARNIRAGFVAAPTMPFETPDHSYEEEKRREKDRERKRAGAGGGRDEEPQAFNAADFRKREVIFQPKKKKVALNREFKKTQITKAKASKRVLKVDGTMKVAALADALGQKAPVIIKKLMMGGVMANINTELDFDTIQLIASEFEYEAINVKRTAAELQEAAAFGDLDAEPVPRAPVVTVMGHVDHGKTSLLDAIREADVAKGEAGGITQHIGAYRVKLKSGGEVTFIDTPGHEAFTSMRARGANVTDVAIIVVAADDGVMPQTVEAINHAKAAEVPIIIAVNKIDKPGANPDRIKQQLTEYEIVPEEWGGSNIFCSVSALNRTGIDELLEQILLVAEVEDLKANPKRSGTGTVIEARLEKGRGAVATLLVQDGTVRVGDNIVAGVSAGRVRAMMNDKGEQVKEATPGMPVEVLGFPEPPSAGDRFDVTKDEDTARQIAETRLKEIEEAKNQTAKGMTLEELFSKVKQGQVHELPIILKADVSGSVEAVKGMLEKASTKEVKVKIVHSAVGGISESDVLLAGTAKGIIIGFNVRPDSVASQRAKEKGVEIKTYDIVYNLVDDVKKAMAGLLQPDRIEKQTARAEVRNVFSVPKAGNIAGCAVVEGKISRSDQVRLVRDGVVVYTGRISSLKRFKDDVREVAQGFECGIGIENFNDIKVGDIIEGFVVEEVARAL